MNNKTTYTTYNISDTIDKNIFIYYAALTTMERDIFKNEAPGNQIPQNAEPEASQVTQKMAFGETVSVPVTKFIVLERIGKTEVRKYL